ncbi:MAG: acetylornithine deacetylase [Deltaproteobacteria bacterium]|nr:acetylornithine deacetylase [Deltaproteobacteria bacterium]
MSDRLVELLAELVAIDSTSTRSNVPVIDALELRLSALGFACERVRYADEAGVEKANLLARVGDGLPELALVGHTDCVPIDVTWTDALRLSERDGNLYGRGACDTQTFIAAAVTAAVKAKARLHRPLLLVFTADEELGCEGAKQLVEAKKGHCRRAIIGEPTGLTPIRANKGYCLADVEVRGAEGHSAYPDQGASAIFRAARLLAKLEAYAKGPLRAATNPAFAPPFPTLNVGLLSGGKARNVIPGACRFTVEWRPLPGQAVEAVLRDVERLRDECAREEPGFEASVTPLRMDQGYDTPAGADVVEFLARETGKAAACVAFGTEGPQLVQLGATPVVFGPGDIAAAHRTGEHVPRAQLERAAAVLEAAILHFCG